MKKNLCILYILGGICAIYGGYLLGGIFPPGSNLLTASGRVSAVLGAPFADYWNGNTFKTILLSVMAYGFFVLYDIARPKKFRFGKEHGTAEMGSVEDLKKFQDKVEEKNRILSRNVRISMDTWKTELNNNLIGIGGSGAGKSTAIVLPNLYRLRTSVMVTDPKGELLRKMGKMLRDNGAVVRVLNLIQMRESMCFNPFVYLREPADVRRLITSIYANTEDKAAAKGEQIWDEACKMYLEALFLYVWMEYPKEEQHIPSVLELMNQAKVGEGNSLGELSRIFSALPKKHPAREIFRRMRQAAGDTIRSVLFTANSKMQVFYNEDLQRILRKDELHLDELGVGVNGDHKTKVALFCLISDRDKTYNFLAGMLYTTLFAELYYQADFIYGGRLPVPVTLWMDEFANISLPDDFSGIVSTARSREIYLSIILQNLSQLKALYKDQWETIVGNCDQFLYLGGNDDSTFKYISDYLDYETIDKRSDSQSYGKSPGSSRSHDTMQRLLMSKSEVRKMGRKKCLILIRGEDPVIDEKYRTFRQKWFRTASQAEASDFIGEEKSCAILSAESLGHYQKMKQKGENIRFYEVEAEELLNFEPEKLGQRLPAYEFYPDNEDGREEETERELLEDGGAGNDVLDEILCQDWTEEQMRVLREAYQKGLTDQEILIFLRPEYSVEEMRKIMENVPGFRETGVVRMRNKGGKRKEE